MNEVAESHINMGWAKEITLDEALKVLEKTHEVGLIHMAYGHSEFFKPGVVNSVCSCCTCCCGPLSGILRFGLAPHILKGFSIEATNISACTSCGVCVERCQFGAREMVNGNLSINKDLCFGCGLCVSTCPTKAITLVEKQGEEAE
jgi:ferredoxin